MCPKFINSFPAKATPGKDTDDKFDTGIYSDYQDGFVIQASIIARVQNK